MEQLPAELMFRIYSFLPQESQSSTCASMAQTSRRLHHTAALSIYRSVRVNNRNFAAFARALLERPAHRQRIQCLMFDLIAAPIHKGPDLDQHTFRRVCELVHGGSSYPRQRPTEPPLIAFIIGMLSMTPDLRELRITSGILDQTYAWANILPRLPKLSSLRLGTYFPNGTLPLIPGGAGIHTATVTLVPGAVVGGARHCMQTSVYLTTLDLILVGFSQGTFELSTALENPSALPSLRFLRLEFKTGKTSSMDYQFLPMVMSALNQKRKTPIESLRLILDHIPDVLYRIPLPVKLDKLIGLEDLWLPGFMLVDPVFRDSFAPHMLIDLPASMKQFVLYGLNTKLFTCLPKVVSSYSRDRLGEAPSNLNLNRIHLYMGGGWSGCRLPLPESFRYHRPSANGVLLSKEHRNFDSWQQDEASIKPHVILDHLDFAICRRKMGSDFYLATGLAPLAPVRLDR